MSLYYEAAAVIAHGELKPEDLPTFRRAIKGLPDGRYVIRVEKFRQRRSNAQARYWWGVVVPLFSEHCGHYKDEMHEILKVQLLPKDVEIVNKETGEAQTIRIGGSTTHLSTTEFKDLIARAQHLGAELGIYIPDPNEVAA